MGGALRLALLGAALVLTAAVLDAAPLYVPGLTLLLLAGGAAGWVLLASRGLRVTRTLAAATVQEGHAVAVRIEVRSPRLPLAAGAVEDPLLDAAVPSAVHRGRSTIRLNARFARRGRRRLAPTRVVVRDPFGLAVRAVAGREHELLVLPAILPVQRTGGDGAGDALGRRAARSRMAAEVQLDGLRPLQAGTSAARISWAAWARTGELLERHLRPDGDDRPVVVLDTRTAPDDPGQERLDAAVRAAASLCVHLAGQGGCSLLLPGDRHPVAVEPGLAAWPRLHVRLALVGAGGLPAAGALTGRQGVIVYVSARPVQRPPPTLSAARGRGRVLVVPGTLAGRTPAFAVGDCLGYDLSARGARPERAA